MGYMRLEMGKNLLGIEGEIAWAVPGELYVDEKKSSRSDEPFTFPVWFLFSQLLTFSSFFPYSTTTNYACYEDGSNCVHTEKYVDPSNDIVAVKRRLSADKKNERDAIGNIRG